MKKTADKKYTQEELIAMINQTTTMDELNDVEELIKSLHLSGDELHEIEMEILCQSDMIYDSYYNPYEHYEDRGSYSPSAPWNAPGMSIHDFI